MLLFWFICDELKMIGIKYFCGMVFCGVCMVYFDGEFICFCQFFMVVIGDKVVIIIEGFFEDGLYLV